MLQVGITCFTYQPPNEICLAYCLVSTDLLLPRCPIRPEEKEQDPTQDAVNLWYFKSNCFLVTQAGRGIIIALCVFSVITSNTFQVKKRSPWLWVSLEPLKFAFPSFRTVPGTRELWMSIVSGYMSGFKIINIIKQYISDTQDYTFLWMSIKASTLTSLFHSVEILKMLFHWHSACLFSSFTMMHLCLSFSGWKLLAFFYGRFSGIIHLHSLVCSWIEKYVALIW